VRRPLVMIPPGGVCSVQELEREAGYWIELVSEQCSAEQMMAARERVARAAGRPAKETKGTEL